MNDTELMRRYADEGDHAAFEELVRRHVDVAYSAAMIRLGKDDLARDACQTTFLALARKAGTFPPDINLGGWVYSTARNSALKIQRTEIRRMQRERNYVDEMRTNPQSREDWSHLALDIHDALDRLKVPERNAIILRFFQNKSLADVGSALGITSDAARMRINRALERLNGHLAKKGITSTASALAAALPTHAAITAPAGLTASISTTVLAGTGTVASATTLTGAAIAIMKTKTIAITALAATVIIGGGVYLAVQPRSEKHQAESELQQSSKLSVPRIGRPGGYAARAGSGSTPKSELAQTDSASDVIIPDSAALEIDPKYLELGLHRLSLMEFETDAEISSLMKYYSRVNTDRVARKLHLRMNLSAEQSARFDEILKLHAEKVNQAEFKRGMARNERFKTMLTDERESLIPFYALETMREYGMELTPEQHEYYRSVEKLVYSDMSLAAFEDDYDIPAVWYKDDAVMKDLYAALDPDQQGELATYIEERAVRRKEEKVLRRTNRLADRLALNEADRTALYSYLYENPAATQDEIAKLLSPELHELLN